MRKQGAFVFATRIVQPLYLLNPKFQASSHFQWPTARFVSDLVGNPEDRFSHNEAQILNGGLPLSMYMKVFSPVTSQGMVKGV